MKWEKIASNLWRTTIKSHKSPEICEGSISSKMKINGKRHSAWSLINTKLAVRPNCFQNANKKASFPPPWRDTNAKSPKLTSLHYVFRNNGLLYSYKFPTFYFPRIQSFHYTFSKSIVCISISYCTIEKNWMSFWYVIELKLQII